jgi:putative glutamine amidotransferase
MNKKTAISRSESKFQFYVEWLESYNIPYEVLDWEKNNFEDIKKCSSLFLTGGADIFPEFYNDWEDGKNREDYIPARDGFEFKLFDYALQNNYPVLGVCRGLQLINCRLNGSLINDIETIRGTNHKKIAPMEDRLHHVTVFHNSLLHDITDKDEGTINSSHHQAIDRLGEGLMINAKADDGIIEGVEWAEKDRKPFLLAVQWHPERFKDKSSPFTKNIIERFKEETNKN